MNDESRNSKTDYMNYMNYNNYRIKKNIKVPAAFCIKMPSLMFTGILNKGYIFLRHVIFEIASDNERQAERKNTRRVT